MRDDVHAEVGHIASLEGVRGLALLWVVLFHYVALRGSVAGDPLVALIARVPALDALARNGYLGVDLFFLLSGFLLVLPWCRRAAEGLPAPSARAFYVRRLRRIVPAYYLQLALLFVLVMPFLYGVGYWRRDLYVYAWNGVAHGLFLQGTSPLTSGSLGVNGALWTLAVEAQFYVLLPLAAPLFVRFPWRTTAAAFALAALWQHAARSGLRPLVEGMQVLGTHWNWSEDVMRRLLAMQLPQYLAHFAFGMLLARAWLALRAVRMAAAARLAAAVAAAALLAYALVRGGDMAGWWALAALGTLLFLAATASSRAARVLLGRGPLAFAGRVSYSAYLWHLPLLVLLNASPLARAPAAAPAFLAALVAVAWASWRFVERPFLARAPAHACGATPVTPLENASPLRAR